MSSMAKLFTLNLMVDKSCNRVLFAESNAQFVEILLIFLTIPLGSILRLTDNHPFGSLHKLLESVEKLNNNEETCRSVKLQTLRHGNNRQSLRFCYICKKCDRLSVFLNLHCSLCGNVMDRRVLIVPDAVTCNFLQKSFQYIISDDLSVFQSSTEVTIEMLTRLNIKQGSSLESVSVDVTSQKIIELLKRLLVSDKPLTDVFLDGHNENKLQIIKYQGLQNSYGALGPSTFRTIPLKLFINKDANQVLFVESNEDFVDLLVSFLIYPMSSVLIKLAGQSFIPCFDNLYKSIEALKLANCFENQSVIDILKNPKLPPYYNPKNPLQVEVIDQNRDMYRYYMCDSCECNSDEVRITPNFTCKGCKKLGSKELFLIDPKSQLSEENHMRSLMYMVTDDLVLKKFSSIMLVNDFYEEVVKGIKVKNIQIGEREALALLHASITSKNVLTDALLGKEEEEMCEK